MAFQKVLISLKRRLVAEICSFWNANWLINFLCLDPSPDSHHVIKKKKRKVAVSKDVHQKEKEWCTLRKKFINKSRSQENSMKNKGLQELLDLDHRTFH